MACLSEKQFNTVYFRDNISNFSQLSQKNRSIIHLIIYCIKLNNSVISIVLTFLLVF